MKKRALIILSLILLLTGCRSKLPGQLEMPKVGDDIVEMEIEDYGVVKFKLVTETPKITGLFKEYYDKGEYEHMNVAGNYPNRAIHLLDLSRDVIYRDLHKESIENGKKYACIRGSVLFLRDREGEGHLQYLAFILNEEEPIEHIERNQQIYGFSDDIKKMYEKYKGISDSHGNLPVIGQVYEGIEILDKVNSEVTLDGYEEGPKIIRFELKKYTD